MSKSYLDYFIRWKDAITEEELDALADELISVPVPVFARLLIAINEANDGAWESYALVRLVNNRSKE